MQLIERVALRMRYEVIRIFGRFRRNPFVKQRCDCLSDLGSGNGTDTHINNSVVLFSVFASETQCEVTGIVESDSYGLSRSRG
jgi:hypothetical protein